MAMQYISKSLLPLLPDIPGKYDVAISFLGVPDVLVDKTNAKKKVAWNHTDYTILNPDKHREREVYSKIDHIVSVSTPCTTQFLKVYPELSNKAVTIENLLSIDFLEQQASEQVTDMVRKVAECVFIPFTVGGGIRTVDDFRAILREGADKVSVNSSAINNPRLISDAADKFGSQCVVVAIDAKRREDGSGWNIYKNGGRIDVGIDAVEWAVKAEALGAGEILLTSMDGDGTKAGYDLELTRAIAGSVSIPVIASGGAGTLEHFKEALTVGKADAALAASLFHYKELEIREVKEYLLREGVSVRL